LQMPTPLANLSVLVSAGPTREAIDPVRYISNHSSGKMGYAVAQAARQLGATVSLVTGPTNLAPPAGMEVVQITTAAQMYDAVMARAPAADVFVSAAAVADYAPAQAADRKLKKHAANMAIELVRTRDVLAAVSALEAAPFTVGFAAETNDMRANAGKKLASKSLDMIAGNDVAQPGIGFNGDENALTVVWEDGEVELPRAAKTIIAQQLMELVAERYHGKRTTAGA
jgi:phosphopantothenoylcysteine decarboxylase/phosphopantothenate--cysteine ligase